MTIQFIQRSIKDNPNDTILQNILEVIEQQDFSKYGKVIVNHTWMNYTILENNSQNEHAMGDYEMKINPSNFQPSGCSILKNNSALSNPGTQNSTVSINSENSGQIGSQDNLPRKVKSQLFKDQMNIIDQENLNRVVNLLSGEINHDDHVLDHIVQIFNKNYSEKYRNKSNDLEEIINSLAAVKQLLYSIIIQLYDDYIQFNLKDAQQEICYKHIKLICNQTIFRKNNDIYLITMMAFKQKHIKTIKKISEKMNSLKKYTAKDYQNIGKFCLEQEYPYKNAINQIKQLSVNPSCLAKLNCIYKAHNLIIQELQSFNKKNNQKLQLVAFDDIFSVYIYILAQTLKGTLFLETIFIESFTEDDDENKFISEKAQTYSYFKLSLEYILKTESDQLIKTSGQIDGIN